MRIILLLALLLVACAAPARQDDEQPGQSSGPMLRIGGALGSYYGATLR